MRLEVLHLTPTIILSVPRFLSFSKTDILEEIARVIALTEQEIHTLNVAMKQDIREIKLEQIGLLVYHFKLLTRLRQDEPEV